MERRLAAVALWGILSLLSIPALAITLSLNPATQVIEQGDIAAADLSISEMGGFAPPSLGAFLVEIVFDETVLSFDSVVYGSGLGDIDPFAFETDIMTSVNPGSVSLDVISFLADFELDALQPDSFTLATLSFVGQTVGTSALGFGSIDLANAEFPSSSIFPDALESADITVEPRQTPVSEPATALLLLTSLLTLFAARHRDFSM